MPIQVPNTLEEALAIGEQRRQAKMESQQDEQIATRVMQRLDFLKEDPAHYEAFRDKIVLAQPRIRSALERTFGPESLSAIMDSSTLETPEERLVKKTRESYQNSLATKLGEAKVEANPEYQNLLSLGKKLKQDTENAISLDPANIAAQKEIMKNKALADQEAEAAKVGTKAWDTLKTAAKVKEQEEKWNPLWLAESGKVFPEVQSAIGDPAKAEAAWMRMVGNPQQGRNNFTDLLSSYHMAQVGDKDTMYPSFTKRGVLLTEDEAKLEEREIADALVSGFVTKGGKTVALDTPIDVKKSKLTYRQALVDRLSRSNVTGTISPYLAASLPWAESTDNLTDASNMKKNAQSMRGLFSTLAAGSAPNVSEKVTKASKKLDQSETKTKPVKKTYFINGSLVTMTPAQYAKYREDNPQTLQ